MNTYLLNPLDSITIPKEIVSLTPNDFQSNNVISSLRMSSLISKLLITDCKANSEDTV